MTGRPSRSHGRAAAATAIVPASARRPSVSERPGRGRARRRRRPYATALTGRSKLTFTGEPEGTVSQRSLTVATGARIVRWTFRVLPSAQPCQPGRRTTASTETVSPGVRSVRGVRRPPRTARGILRPPGPNARTLSSFPPNGCTSTLASAVVSPASVMPDQSRTPATTPASARTRNVRNPHRTRRRARRGEGRSRERSNGEVVDFVATPRGYGALALVDFSNWSCQARRPTRFHSSDSPCKQALTSGSGG